MTLTVMLSCETRGNVVCGYSYGCG